MESSANERASLYIPVSAAEVALKPEKAEEALATTASATLVDENPSRISSRR